jgi:hypothetical protein
MTVPPVTPAAMAAAGSAIGNAEHALDATYGSADTCADSPTDHGANRAGRTTTFTRALMAATLHTADDALRVRQMWNGEQRQRCRRCCEAQPDGIACRQRSGRGFHLQNPLLRWPAYGRIPNLR